MSILNSILSILEWPASHDISNTVALILTSMLLPLVLYWYDNCWATRIPGLELSIDPGRWPSGEDSIVITFRNNTGSVVYITRPCLIPQAGTFRVHSSATRNLSDGSHKLEFENGAGQFVIKEVTIQTGGNIRTGLALDAPLDLSVRQHICPWWRRLLRWPRFFRIQFIAMVGDRKHKISLVH